MPICNSSQPGLYNHTYVEPTVYYQQPLDSSLGCWTSTSWPKRVILLAVVPLQAVAAEAARKRQAAKKVREETAFLNSIQRQMTEAQEAAAAKAAQAKAAAEEAKRANIEAKQVLIWPIYIESQGMYAPVVEDTYEC